MLKVREGYTKYVPVAFSGLKHTNILKVMDMAPNVIGI